MIVVLSGRCLSRAWLAVAQASTDPDSLFPELTTAAARFELASRERVVVPLSADEFANWRRVGARPVGAQSLIGLSTSNLARLTKAAQHAGAGSIKLHPAEEGGAMLWSVAGKPRLEHTPTGVVAVVRPDTERAEVAEPAADVDGEEPEFDFATMLRDGSLTITRVEP